MRRDRDRHRRVDSRQLLDRDRVREGVCAGAAVLLGNRHAHHTELRELRDDLVREPALAIDLLGDRRDLLDGELPHRGSQQLVLVVEVEVQPASLCASSTISRTP